MSNDHGDAVETLVAAAADANGSLECDGLVLESRTDGYAIEVPTLVRTGLSEAAARETLAEFPEYAHNWAYWQRTVGGEGTARRAFLRWCERAPLEGTGADGNRERDEGGGVDGSDEADDRSGHTHADVLERYEALANGVHRTWGELLVTTVLASNGERRYGLRHVDDAGTLLEEEPATDLEVYDDPRDARDLATSDEMGRYRPLKTAPSLIDGWAFPDLSGAQLVEAVGFLYPATIANWHRERRGELDVDHWLETAERQTGIYDVVDELPREAVDWMAEACCVDSQCLKRREWEYEEGDDLSVDGGDGVFPCREPCSLVIAAARKWAILETEETKTWEFELTTSEKNQLEALIDAVAEGRIDEIREADVNDGANRYRARYLRAKRMNEEGSFGVDSSED